MKIAFFTDLHFGKRQDSVEFSDDCLDFVKWATSRAQREGASHLVFGGDWHHNRTHLNLHTMNRSLTALRHVSANFETVDIILGNHDLYFKEALNVHSLEFAREFKNIRLIEEPLRISDDVSLVPWLVDSAKERVRAVGAPFMFGHFEISQFRFNSGQTVEHGSLSPEDFQDAAIVFSGHFHNRQQIVRPDGTLLLYTGAAFPHNFEDAGQRDRGLTILDTDSGEHVLHTWEDQPTFDYLTLEQLESAVAEGPSPKRSVKIFLDGAMGSEDVRDLKNFLINELRYRDVSFSSRSSLEITEGLEAAAVETLSVDNMVFSLLERLQDDKKSNLDVKLLQAIYRDIQGAGS
jgi:DNA repair exonuclease SbcCD nuclease subunit